jgi:hypothetical protein
MIDRLRAIVDQVLGTESKAIGVFAGSKSFSVRVVTIAKVLMAVVVVSATTVVVGFAFLGFGSGSALAVSVSAADIDISTNDGNVSSVTIEPGLTHSWTGVDSGVHQIQTTVDVSNDGSSWRYANVFAKTCDLSSNPDFDCGQTSATVDQSIRTISIAGGGDYQTDAFSLSDFNASDGETKTTTVYVRLTVTLYDESSNALEETQVVKSFDVTVTNVEGQLSVSGALNSSVSTPT